MSDKARDARDEEEDREGPDEDESDDWGGNSPGSLTICRCFIQVGFGQGVCFWKKCSSYMCVFKLNTLCNVREIALQEMQYCVFWALGVAFGLLRQTGHSGIHPWVDGSGL